MHCSHRAGGWWGENGGGGWGPSLRDHGGWLCREPAVLLPPRPCLCLYLASETRIKGRAGGGIKKRTPLCGPCRDWRRCAELGTEAALSTPLGPRDRTLNFGWGALQTGAQAGRQNPPSRPSPLQANASNVDAWPMGRHRLSTDTQGRGGVVSSLSGWRESRGVSRPLC